MAPPLTPMAAPRASRTRGQPVEVDKENMPPPSQQLPALSTPIGKGGLASTPVATPVGKGTSTFSSTPQGSERGDGISTPNPEVRSNGAKKETPVSGQTGAAPKSLEEWSELLISLPTATATDCARLERLYERALGSGGGNEELEVGENKDKEIYVALWLRRIMDDPDEGTSYTKFMAKWHIGRKVAAVYILRAMLSSPDKAVKALHEGVPPPLPPPEIPFNIALHNPRGSLDAFLLLLLEWGARARAAFREGAPAALRVPASLSLSRSLAPSLSLSLSLSRLKGPCMSAGIGQSAQPLQLLQDLLARVSAGIFPPWRQPRGKS